MLAEVLYCNVSEDLSMSDSVLFVASIKAPRSSAPLPATAYYKRLIIRAVIMQQYSASYFELSCLSKVATMLLSVEKSSSPVFTRCLRQPRIVPAIVWSKYVPQFPLAQLRSL